MNIADDLVRAYNDGYAQGKTETEAYLLHCGDLTPVTNADRIRAMTDEELAVILARSCPDNDVDRDYCGLEDGTCDCVCCWFEWLEDNDG